MDTHAHRTDESASSDTDVHEDSRAQEVQEIAAWGFTHEWATLVLPIKSDPHARPKGLILVKPGKLAGLIKMHIDLEFE